MPKITSTHRIKNFHCELHQFYSDVIIGCEETACHIFFSEKRWSIFIILFREVPWTKCLVPTFSLLNQTNFQHHTPFIYLASTILSVKIGRSHLGDNLYLNLVRPHNYLLPTDSKMDSPTPSKIEKYAMVWEAFLTNYGGERTRKEHLFLNLNFFTALFRYFTTHIF